MPCNSFVYNQSCSISSRAWVGFEINKHNHTLRSGSCACISSRITTVIHVSRSNWVYYNWYNEPFAASPKISLNSDMHGLIFETSIWLLAGSTRYLARMFKRGADRAWARPTFPRRKLSAAEMFFNSRGHQGRPDKQRPSRPSKDRRSDERVKPSHGERSLSRNKSSPRVRSFGVPAARSSRSQNQLLAVRRN